MPFQYLCTEDHLESSCNVRSAATLTNLDLFCYAPCESPPRHSAESSQSPCAESSQSPCAVSSQPLLLEESVRTLRTWESARHRPSRRVLTLPAFAVVFVALAALVVVFGGGRQRHTQRHSGGRRQDRLKSVPLQSVCSPRPAPAAHGLSEDPPVLSAAPQPAFPRRAMPAPWAPKAAKAGNCLRPASAALLGTLRNRAQAPPRCACAQAVKFRGASVAVQHCGAAMRQELT